MMLDMYQIAMLIKTGRGVVLMRCAGTVRYFDRPQGCPNAFMLTNTTLHEWFAATKIKPQRYDHVLAGGLVLFVFKDDVEASLFKLTFKLQPYTLEQVDSYLNPDHDEHD